MSRQGWQETLISSTADGGPIANSTTAQSILPTSARYTLPSNFFSEIGKALRVTAQGRVSTSATTPGTLTLDVRFGTVATPIIVFNGGAMNLNTTAQTNATWLYEALLVCRTIGAGTSATMLGTGRWVSRAIIGSSAVATSGVPTTPLPDTAPAAGTGFDSTITNVVDMFAAWSAANASNSITTHQYTLESMN